MSSSAFRSTSPTRISSRSCDPSAKHAPEGIAEERFPPELQPLAGRGFPPNIAGFKSDPIHDCNVNSVRNGMSPLNRAPRVVLGHPELLLLRRMPTDRRRIKEHLRPLQGC